MRAPKSIQGFLIKADFVQCEQKLMIVSVKCSFWSVNKMYFGTEARLLKAEGSQEAMVEVKASSGMSGLWEAEAGGEKIQWLGKGMQESFSREAWWGGGRITWISVFLLLFCIIPYYLLEYSSWLYYLEPCGNRQVRVCSWGRELRG